MHIRRLFYKVKKHIATWTRVGFQLLVVRSMLSKLKYYPVWLSVSNTKACPVKSNKCIPSGFVLTCLLHHLFWVPSVSSCSAILLPPSYITNDSGPYTHLALTWVPRVLSDDYYYFSSSVTLFSWPITVTACAFHFSLNCAVLYSLTCTFTSAFQSVYNIKELTSTWAFRQSFFSTLQ